MNGIGQELTLWFVVFPIGLVIFIAVVTLVARGMIGKAWGQDAQVLQTGQPANATILDLSDTGTTVNDNPVVKVQLLVEAAGQSGYTVSKTMMISRLQIPQFQPGSKLSVRIDPRNPNNVAIAAIGQMPRTA